MTKTMALVKLSGSGCSMKREVNGGRTWGTPAVKGGWYAGRKHRAVV